MKEVKNMIISDGITYSGAVESDGYMDVPHGMGMCKYSDHNELGMFQDGELNGIAYINYHDWMSVGLCRDRLINGWGMKVDKGRIQFGVFEDSILKVNLTPLVEIFWHKVIEETEKLQKSAISVLKNGEIFVGAPQYLFYGKFGFHFLGNGEVFLGRCDYNEKGRTGKFLHFDLDYNITKGEYKDGELVREIDDDEFIKACEVFVNHAYMDFDIHMNYSMDSFLFGEKKVMHIVEMGNTPDNIIIKANICRVVGDRIECEGGTNEDTIWFMFPNDNDHVTNGLMHLANREDPWIPIFADYCVEFFDNFREADNDHQVVYKHVSCWDEDANFVLDDYYSTDSSEYGAEFGDEEDDDDDDDYFGPKALGLIPNCSMKKEQLESQWRNNGWYYTYPSLRDYVESLAEGDDVENFFGWLFDDSSFNGTEAWNLPHNYREAYFQFLNLFPDLD